MSNTYTHLGLPAGKTVIWGTGDSLSTYGILQKLSRNEAGTFADLKDENGQIIARTKYDQSITLTAELIMKSANSKPSIGSTVTIDGTKYICENVAVTAENETYTQLSLTLVNYNGITLS